MANMLYYKEVHGGKKVYIEVHYRKTCSKKMISLGL